MSMNDKETERLNANIDKKLYKRLKQKLLDMDSNVTEFVITMARKFVDGEITFIPEDEDKAAES